MKATFYFLRIISTREIFYVGITSTSLNNRLAAHRLEYKTRQNTAKNDIFSKYKDDIEIVPIETQFGEWKTLLKREKALIKEYLLSGHPLTNQEHITTKKGGKRVGAGRKFGEKKVHLGFMLCEEKVNKLGGQKAVRAMMYKLIDALPDATSQPSV